MMADQLSPVPSLKFQWPSITVVIVTYRRADEVRAVIRGLQERIRYHGQLSYHLADGGSPNGYIRDIMADFPHLSVSHTVCTRGMGANVNTALAAIPVGYTYLNVDDMVPCRTLDFNAGVALLESVPQIGAVRYDGIEGHRGLVLSLEELDYPPLYYMRIRRRLSIHQNCYSGRPHLRHPRFTAFYGPYNEGYPLGPTELAYAMRFKGSPWGPSIAVLSSGIEHAFQHIGVSWQGTKHDVHV